MEASSQSPDCTSTSSAVLTTPNPQKKARKRFLLRRISEIVPSSGARLADTRKAMLSPALQIAVAVAALPRLAPATWL